MPLSVCDMRADESLDMDTCVYECELMPVRLARARADLDMDACVCVCEHMPLLLLELAWRKDKAVA